MTKNACQFLYITTVEILTNAHGCLFMSRDYYECLTSQWGDSNSQPRNFPLASSLYLLCWYQEYPLSSTFSLVCKVTGNSAEESEEEYPCPVNQCTSWIRSQSQMRNDKYEIMPNMPMDVFLCLGMAKNNLASVTTMTEISGCIFLLLICQ